MRNILLFWLLILKIYPCSLSAQTLDSIDRNPRVNTIQYQQIPSLLYSIQRYNIFSDYSDNLKIHDFNFKIQQLLRTNGRDNNSLSENFQFLKESYFDIDKDLK
ncbi:MAG: hypothetical protein ACOYOA_03020 [Saprospiraceae bacterium]